MAQLILRNLDGHEIGRRAMHPSERFAVYHTYTAGALFAWGQGRYRLHSVAWRVPEETCVVSVTFDSWEPSAASPEC